MNNSSPNHNEFVKQRQALIENSKLRGNSNSKFYILGGTVAILLIVPVISYVFLTQRILDNSGSSNNSQVANVEEEVIVTPIKIQLTPVEESSLTSTPSATPTIPR